MIIIYYSHGSKINISYNLVMQFEIVFLVKFLSCYLVCTGCCCSILFCYQDFEFYKHLNKHKIRIFQLQKLLTRTISSSSSWPNYPGTWMHHGNENRKWQWRVENVNEMEIQGVRRVWFTVGMGKLLIQTGLRFRFQ